MATLVSDSCHDPLFVKYPEFVQVIIGTRGDELYIAGGSASKNREGRIESNICVLHRKICSAGKWSELVRIPLIPSICVQGCNQTTIYKMCPSKRWIYAVAIGSFQGGPILVHFFRICITSGTWTHLEQRNTMTIDPAIPDNSWEICGSCRSSILMVFPDKTTLKPQVFVHDGELVVKTMRSRYYHPFRYADQVKTIELQFKWDDGCFDMLCDEFQMPDLEGFNVQMFHPLDSSFRLWVCFAKPKNSIEPLLMLIYDRLDNSVGTFTGTRKAKRLVGSEMYKTIRLTDVFLANFERNVVFSNFYKLRIE